MISFHINSIILGFLIYGACFGIWRLLSRPACHVKIFFRDRDGEKKRFEVTYAGAKESGFIPIELMENTLTRAGFAGATIDGITMEYRREIIMETERL